jgi:hypothetical protein
VIAHPTHILRTTRSGSRSAVQRLNQSLHVRKGEPKRRSACAGARARIVEPDAKNAETRAAVTDASLLLVILHYLLKNNRRIYEYVMGRSRCPPGYLLSPTFYGGASE